MHRERQGLCLAQRAPRVVAVIGREHLPTRPMSSYRRFEKLDRIGGAKHFVWEFICKLFLPHQFYRAFQIVYGVGVGVGPHTPREYRTRHMITPVEGFRLINLTSWV